MILRTYKSISLCLSLALTLLISAADSEAQEQKISMLASKIIDQDVYDKNHKLIGEVDEIIIRRSGRTKKLTVEFGGFLDIGDKLVAISFKNFTMEKGGITVNALLEQLKKRPKFDYYTHDLRPEYYYRIRPYSGPYHYPPPGFSYTPDVQWPPIEPYEWAFSPSRFLASVVMDRGLINEAGKTIGWVEDLLINRKDNRVKKIIISSAGIMGEDTFMALPYEPLGFTAYGLVYAITPEELKDFVYPYKPGG